MSPMYLGFSCQCPTLSATSLTLCFLQPVSQPQSLLAKHLTEREKCLLQQESSRATLELLLLYLLPALELWRYNEHQSFITQIAWIFCCSLHKRWSSSLSAPILGQSSVRTQNFFTICIGLPMWKLQNFIKPQNGSSLSILASRMSFQEPKSLLACMNVKHSQVTSSLWLTPHRYLSDMKPSSIYQDSTEGFNRNRINLRSSWQSKNFYAILA